MQAREQGKGDTPGGAAQQAPATVRADAAAGGWLDRLAAHSLAGASAHGALRPRLPYPFEALKFAHDEGGALPAAGRVLGAAPMPVQAPPAAPAAPRLRPPPVPDAGHAEPARRTQPLPPATPEVRAPHPSAFAPPRAPLPQSVPGAPPTPFASPARPAPPRGATHADGQPLRSAAAARPSMPAAGSTPSAPSTGRRAPAEAGAHARVEEPRSMAPPLQAGGQTSARPARDDGDPAHASGRLPVPGSRHTSPQASPLHASALRSAAVPQAPLTAGAPQQAAQEITIDIHIGRIDVRAPAVHAAPPAAAAPARESGDALRSYLLRRGRGARS